MMGGSSSPTGRGYDFFFGNHGPAGAAAVGDGLDDPEDHEEAGDGAEDDSDHGSRAGTFVDIGVGGGDYGRVYGGVLAAGESDGGVGCCGGDEG